MVSVNDPTLFLELYNTNAFLKFTSGKLVEFFDSTNNVTSRSMVFKGMTGNIGLKGLGPSFG